MSDEVGVITGHLSRDHLLKVLDAAKVEFQKQFDAAMVQMDLDIDKELLRKPMRGMLWWRRERTRFEATQTLCEGWHWDASYNKRKAQARLERETEIRNIAKSDLITNIRLPENDLLLLKDFL
jgi:hypothetical protein